MRVVRVEAATAVAVAVVVDIPAAVGVPQCGITARMVLVCSHLTSTVKAVNSNEL